MANEPSSPEPQTQRVSVWAYVSLVVVVVFFSGYFSGDKSMLGVLDFSGLIGKFGTMKDAAKATYVGMGGTGARQGFLFGLSLLPGVMLALGVVEIAEHIGALRAAQRLLTPILRPVLGLPGGAGLALISSLQSTDAAAAMTRSLHEQKIITTRELDIFCAFQFSAGASVINYFTIGVALFPFLSVSVILPLGVILFYKVVGANIMRVYLRFAGVKEEPAHV